MKVAVVTPYFDVPIEWLEKCHASVKAQTYSAEHFLVADGNPLKQALDFDAQHITLPVTHNDYGDTPRSIASLSAASQGFDAIAYLDADNWLFENHVETLVEAHKETGAAICASFRALYSLKEEHIGYCLNSDERSFSDTNCMLVTKEAFDVLPTWAMMDQWAHAIGDRVFWYELLRRGNTPALTELYSSAYRTSFHGHYEALGQPIPKEIGERRSHVEIALERWEDEGNPSLDYELKVKK